MEGAMGVLANGQDSVSLRQRVLANDLANLNTPGFQAQDVSFAKTLSGAIKPRVVTAPGLMTANGNGVNVDATLVALEQTTYRLQGIDALMGARVQAENNVITNMEGA